MGNYSKSCFPFGFDKYMAGARRQHRVSVHALSFPHDSRKRRRHTQAHIRTRGHCIFFFPWVFQRYGPHFQAFCHIAMQLEVGFSSEQNSNSLPSPLRELCGVAAGLRARGKRGIVSEGEGLQMPMVTRGSGGERWAAQSELACERCFPVSGEERACRQSTSPAIARN